MKKWIKNELKSLGLQIAFLTAIALIAFVVFMVVGYCCPEAIAKLF